MSKPTALEIERAEDAYTDYARLAEESPHRWGAEEETELARLAAALRRLYDAAGTDEFDRVQL